MQSFTTWVPCPVCHELAGLPFKMSRRQASIDFVECHACGHTWRQPSGPPLITIPEPRLRKADLPS
jgi:Zn ribbon nucleic-acid-binding protein